MLLPGGWAASMEAEGFEVFETLYNDAGLQARWARERNFAHLIFQDNYLFNILVEQIKWFKPQIIFLYAGAFFHLERATRERLRAIGPANLIISGFWGDELPPTTTYNRYFGDLDIVFCSSPIYQKHFESAGIKAVTVGNAFDPSIKYDATVEKKHNFVFCGTTGFGIPEHLNRYYSLRDLLSRTTLEMWSDEPRNRSIGLNLKISVLKAFSRLPTRLLKVITYLGGRLRHIALLSLRSKDVEVGPWLLLIAHEHPLKWIFEGEKPLRKLFRGRIKKQPVNATDYYKLLAESKIVLNIHRDEDADLGNIRCFEATGVGSCLVTDRGNGLRNLFDIENDIVTFDTVDECIAKVKFLLEHPEEIDRIAKNGQRTTLARHTVAHRSHIIASALREFAGKPRLRKRRVVLATYDLQQHPISYDVAFFLQAADIYRKLTHCEEVLVSIVSPASIKNQPGVSPEVDAIVDSHAREFRVSHICIQMAELMPSIGVINLKSRPARDFVFQSENLEIVPFPTGESTHHSEYYRLVNGNPDLLTGFSASVEAHRYVQRWLDTISEGRKVLCVTLRQYEVDTARNTNMQAWESFLDRVDKNKFAIVILPDTDHISDFKKSPFGIYPHFEPACFDVDLRIALYEAAYLNMFVNNGPSVAATLDKKVNYLMFKILLPDVPTCAADFLRWLGYEIGATPKYATPFQKWVWEHDSADVLWREFCKMCEKLEGSRDIRVTHSFQVHQHSPVTLPADSIN